MKKLKNEQAVKQSGAVYTPAHIVSAVLDVAGYTDDIIGKHVIDNSSGGGAFLVEIVKRYCARFFACYALSESSRSALKSHLETYIHGIEIDKRAISKCCALLDSVTAELGIHDVRWDIRYGSSLSAGAARVPMDFVVGNPPYVRIHNLGASTLEVRGLTFSSYGMTDLYLAFFDIGLQMLAPNGRLCLITPSSWLTSRAASAFRDYLRNAKALRNVVDLGHYQPFDANTYTMITLLCPSTRHESIRYSSFDGQRFGAPLQLPYDDCFSGSGLVFLESAQRRLLREIEASGSGPVSVKNGFATLADSVFIGPYAYRAGTIPVVKASTGRWSRCIFPYTEEGVALSESDFAAASPGAYQHLVVNRARLLDRAIDDAAPWFTFGRSQALRDVAVEKVAVNSLVRSSADVRLVAAPAGSGVYGGIYIRGVCDIPTLRRWFDKPEFMQYISALRKYKSGGYYTYSAEELGRYLNWCHATDARSTQRVYVSATERGSAIGLA